MSRSQMKMLYTDGGVIKKNPSPIGGTWAYCLVDAKDNLLYEDYGIMTPNKLNGLNVTNNQMELYAVIMGLETVQRDMIVHVLSDSEITLGRIFKGYSMENIPEWIVAALEEQKKRLTVFKKFPYTLLSGHPTRLQLETGIGKRGHPASRWNKRADDLCRKAGEEYLKWNADWILS